MNLKNLSFPFLVLACIAITIFIFQPGYLNADAVDQLGQARSGQYSDWHPPVMSWVWSWLDKIVAGAMGMFVLQVILFWSGLGLIAAYITPKLGYRALILLLGAYPPLFMLLSAVIKDILMAASFLFGFAILLWAGRKRSLALFFLSSFFIAYGMLTRHNAILIAGPIFLYAGLVFIDLVPFSIGKLPPLWKGMLVGAALFVAAFLLGNVWSGSITKLKSYPIQQIMVHDLTAITLRMKTDLLPDYLAVSEQPSMKDLRRIYNVRSLKNLFWPDFTPIHFKLLTDPALVNDLTNTWMQTVLEYPRAYLEHRWNVFAATMGITVNKACGPYYYEETVYKPKGLYQSDGNFYSENPVTDRLFTLVEPLRESPVYWNWVYVLICLILFAVSLFVVVKSGFANAPFAVIALTLSMGASLYALANIFVAISCDFRYVHWNVITVLVSAAFLIAEGNKLTQVR
jgi:hypothetical protein